MKFKKFRLILAAISLLAVVAAAGIVATPNEVHAQEPQATSTTTLSVDKGSHTEGTDTSVIFTVTITPAPTSPVTYQMKIVQSENRLHLAKDGVMTPRMEYFDVTVPISGSVNVIRDIVDDNIVSPPGSSYVAFTTVYVEPNFSNDSAATYIYDDDETAPTITKYTAQHIKITGDRSSSAALLASIANGEYSVSGASCCPDLTHADVEGDLDTDEEIRDALGIDSGSRWIYDGEVHNYRNRNTYWLVTEELTHPPHNYYYQHVRIPCSSPCTEAEIVSSVTNETWVTGIFHLNQSTNIYNDPTWDVVKTELGISDGSRAINAIDMDNISVINHNAGRNTYLLVGVR